MGPHCYRQCITDSRGWHLQWDKFRLQCRGTFLTTRPFSNNFLFTVMGSSSQEWIFSHAYTIIKIKINSGKNHSMCCIQVKVPWSQQPSLAMSCVEVRIVITRFLTPHEDKWDQPHHSLQASVSGSLKIWEHHCMGWHVGECIHKQIGNVTKGNVL